MTARLGWRHRRSGSCVLALVAGLGAPVPVAAEVCRFEGTASHSGRVAVRTEVSVRAGVLTVDVTLAAHAVAWAADVQYLTQEISTWRGGEMQSVAVNARTVVDGRITRQQWDVFVRGPGGLEARRVQARTLAEFQRRHPRFVEHWTMARFGEGWLQDYAAAASERRPDLDLPAQAMVPGLRSPLALAFYWSRWLPGGGGEVPVFLPGFKHNAQARVAIGPGMPGDGWRRWQAPLRYPGLDGAASSMVAWASPDGYLLQLGFEVHAPQGAARGLVGAQGCQGVQVAPAGYDHG